MRCYIYVLLSTIISSTVHLSPIEDESTCGYAACPKTDLDSLNVHLIPHSHDDVGWLKTVDQYYFRDVQNVISSVIGALNQNPNRTFIQVETIFFKRWWDQQNDIVKQNVQKLVDNGQFEITNGGWCMNDEATVIYQSTIDQYTLGLRTIDDILGPCGRPKAAWQIDVFGHSREQASITAKMGFDSLSFMRLDYRDREKRLNEKTADLLWMGSQSVNTSYVFTSIFYTGSYGFPSGFCFDHQCNDEPIINDEDSTEYNYQQRVEDFADYVKGQASKYPSNNIMIPMGDDVRYQASFINYINIDRLIRGFELFPQTFEDKPIKLYYSTPACYAKSVNNYVNANNHALDIKTDDFLSYATDGYGYWVGFYVARPSTKWFERQGNRFLQIAKQLAAIRNLPYDNKIQHLKDAMGVIQHHDAITGTEKVSVLKDYHRILYAAFQKANEEVDPALSSLIAGSDDQFHFDTCLFSNYSSCAPTSSSTFTVAVYNPLSRTVSSPIEIPVSSESWSISDPLGANVDYQVTQSIYDFSYVTNVPISPLSLVFMAKDLPPMGYQVYTFTSSSKKPNQLSYGNDNTKFEIDDSTGLLKSVTMNGITVEVTQDLYYYKSGSYSGAYIFVPLTNDKYRVADDKVEVTEISGSVYQGVIQTFAPWAKQIIKVYNDDDSHIEIEWVIGPLDMKDETGEEVGKEVISVFKTNLQSESNFYTDSNGRELLKRTRNYRPTFEYTNEEPIAGNYHPVNTRVSLKDEQNDVEFAVLTDRTQGATSLEDGTLEIMIQRACPHNDFLQTGRKVGDNINDQEYDQAVVIRGKHYLVVGPTFGNGEESLAAIQRDVVQRKLLFPWSFVTNENEGHTIRNPQFSNLRRNLDKNVHILTLEPWKDDTVLLRLEHTFEIGEDDKLSQPVTIDLSDLFIAFTVTELQETTLAANMLLTESQRLEWPGVQNAPVPELVDLKVTLNPMEIRTFLAKIVMN